MKLLEFRGRKLDKNGDQPLYHVPVERVALIAFVWNDADEFEGADVHIDGAGCIMVDIFCVDAINDALNAPCAIPGIHRVLSVKQAADASLRALEADRKAVAEVGAEYRIEGTNEAGRLTIEGPGAPWAIRYLPTQEFGEARFDTYTDAVRAHAKIVRDLVDAGV